MNVAYSHSKRSFLTICLVVTQADVEHYQRIKLDQKENADYELSNLPTHLPVFQYDRKKFDHCYKDGFGWKKYIRSTELLFL